MFANVVVLTYQSPDVQSFTYEIPKELETKIKVGQLVSVPFGKRNPLGLIIHLRGEKPYTSEVPSNKIKSVNTILFPTPILLPYQIELLKWMSFYYHAPMVNCLKAILPDLPNAKRLTTNAGNWLGVKRSALNVQQTLILVPTINRIPETLARFTKAKNYVIYHAEQKIGERLESWLKILSGNVDFIFGSRSAIFTPCPNLQKIIINDEHDGVYKDERSPYYDTLTIAEKLSVLSGCKIQIIDSSPKVTTYFSHYHSAKGHLRGESSLHLGGGGIGKEPKVQIVSMLEEKAAGNRLPVSDILSNYLKLGAKKQKRVLLFLNKKVESGHIYCRSCKYSEFALVQLETCPNCGSADIWFNSLNISSLANLVRKIVPDVKINLLAEGYNLLPTTNYQLPTIDIATASIFYSLIPEKYDLVALVAADSALNISDIGSSEKVYSQIMDLKKITRGLLLIQTYNPDHIAIKSAAAAGSYETFFKNLLAERKALVYPPFAFLIKLSIKGKKEPAIEEEAQNLFDDLSNQLPTTNYQLPTILGPYKALFSKLAKYNIILKIPVTDYNLSSRQKAREILDPYLQKVPQRWQITTEPDNIN